MAHNHECIITLDIETTPTVNQAVHAEIAASITAPGNYKKPESIAEWEATQKPALVHDAILKTSFDGSRGHIAVIGAAVNDEDPVSFWREGTEPHKHEGDILAEFFEWLMQAYKPTEQMLPRFVGHNIANFDLRFMFQRAIILGIRPPAFIPFNDKPWSDRIYDTMVQWSGVKGSISQDQLSRALGQDGKGDMDGSKVWGAVQEGRIAEVASYCEDDVWQARNNYKRMNFLPVLKRVAQAA